MTMAASSPAAFGVGDIAPMPGWIASARSASPEEAAFFAGAALAHLQQAVASHHLPQPLWRERLALEAAVTCAGLVGRGESVGELRDAVHLLRPGDFPGPGGEIFQKWRLATSGPISAKALDRVLPEISPDRIADCLNAQGSPVARAARVLEAVLVESPRAETAALILADATLSRATNWPHIVPILGPGLKARTLRATGDDLRAACDRAVLTSAGSATGAAIRLVRHASRLHAVAPKLRARNAQKAVELFLCRDAVAPMALTHLMSARAARRLCDRLVTLGAVRELTGRDSFRLYGV